MYRIYFQTSLDLYFIPTHFLCGTVSLEALHKIFFFFFVHLAFVIYFIRYYRYPSRVTVSATYVA